MSEILGQPEWFLEGYLGEQKTLRRWIIRPLPYCVGRNADMNLSLPYQSVSGRHAEFYIADNTLRIRDLGSTNGTFINRKRLVEDVVIQEHDFTSQNVNSEWDEQNPPLRILPRRCFKTFQKPTFLSRWPSGQANSRECS